MARLPWIAALVLLASEGACALKAKIAAARDDDVGVASQIAAARTAEEARLAALGEAEAAKEKSAFVKGAAPVPPLSVPGDDTELVFLVSSFEDTARCGRTLFWAFEQAARPARLTVRVLQAREESDRGCLSDFRAEHLVELCKKDAFAELMSGLAVDKNRSFISSPQSMEACRDAVLRRIHSWAIHPSQAKGPVHQRGMTNLLLEFEHPDAMCLSTDSHMGFSEGWDRLLIQDWLSTRNEFAVLTVYPAFLRDAHQKVPASFPTLCGYEHEVSGMEHGMPRGRGSGSMSRLPGTKPFLTMNWAAGLSFHRCHAERAVPADVHLKWMFSGEEADRAVRLWTHGYDLYTPTIPAVTHDYSHAKQGFWKFQEGDEERAASQARLSALMGLRNRPEPKEEAREPYALGTQRSMEDFVRWTRQDFGDAWGPWLREHGLAVETNPSYCRSLPRLPVKDEAELVASIRTSPPPRADIWEMLGETPPVPDH